MFERVLARLMSAEPGICVLKGGMALEVRLDAVARLTKDADLGLREDHVAPEDLHDRLVRAFAADPQGDRFELAPSPPEALATDGGGRWSWRVKVSAELAGKPFGRIKLDISPRPHEIDRTDRIELPNTLAFAGVPATVAKVVDLHRHAAEKLNAMVRTFVERENSRVRDLYDLALLIEHGLLDASALAAAVRQVWAERESSGPPTALPPFPASWPLRYEYLAAREASDSSFRDAESAARRLWNQMFAEEET